MNTIKTSFLIILFCISTAFTSENPNKLILGKWKIDVDASRKHFEKVFVQGENAEHDAIAKAMVHRMFEYFVNIVSEYKENGEVLTHTKKVNHDGTSTSNILKGNWKISKDSKKLIVVENGNTKEVELLSISEDKMEVSLSGRNENPVVLVFVRIN